MHYRVFFFGQSACGVPIRSARVFRCALSAQVGIIQIHGGSLESGSEISGNVANRTVNVAVRFSESFTGTANGRHAS